MSAGQPSTGSTPSRPMCHQSKLKPSSCLLLPNASYQGFFTATAPCVLACACRHAPSSCRRQARSSAREFTADSTTPHSRQLRYTGPPPDLPTPLSPRRLPAHFSASCRLRSLACEAAQASALRQEAFRETRISSRTRVRIRISNEASRRPRRKLDLASAQILVQCYYCWCRRDYGYHITLLTASPAQPASSF